MKNKKPACMLLVTMLVFGMAMINVGAVTQLPRLFVDPSIYTATYLGEVFAIDIKIANASNLQSVLFKLGYNTTILDATDVVEGPFMKSFGNTFAGLSINETAGYIDVAIILSSYEGPAEGNGTLATVTFNVTHHEPASCVFHLYDNYLADPQANLIDHETNDGFYEFIVLSLTLATNKKFYYQWEIVNIYSNLTVNGARAGLVALEIDPPSNYPIVARTMQSGSPPPGEISILEVVPCDDDGDPKTSFKRGATDYLDFFYVKVTVKNNNLTEAKNVVLVANSYDMNTVSLGLTSVKILPLNPNTAESYILSIPIQDWASLGTATVYANAFTDWPGRGPYGDHPFNGTSYCPEKSATFQITDGSSMMVTTTATTGSYNLTFHLSLSNALGNYTIYATASYQGFQVASNTTFEIIIFGDVTGDGKVNILDVGTVSGAMTQGIYDSLYDLAEPYGPPINILDVASCASAMVFYG